MVDWDVRPLEQTSESSSGIEPDLKDFLGETHLTTLRSLKEFHGEEKTLPDVVRTLDIDYDSLEDRSLEDRGLILNVENGKPESYTTSMKGDELLANFDLIELGGRDKLVRNFVYTFEDNPESLESLDRVGIDSDWSGMVERLEDDYGSEDRVGRGYFESLDNFLSFSQFEGFISSLMNLELDFSAYEDLEEERDEDSVVVYTGSSKDFDIEEVVDGFDIFDGELEEFNRYIEEEGIQVSSLESVSKGFYAIDAYGGPWFVERPDVPNYIDLENDKVVLSKDSSHNVTRLPRGVVEGYFDSETEEYREV